VQYDRTEVSKLQNMMQTLREELAAYRNTCEDTLNRANRAEAELARTKANSYPHMCRDGHAQIGHSTEDEMCPVCKAESLLAKCREALEEIKLGAGPYSMDPMEHASNTIEAMKELANKALALITGGRRNK